MILELYQGEGFLPKRSASTGGGEFAGPCPWCGGKDRFRLWPNQGESGKYWCRGCGRRGDTIQFLRERRGLGYREACQVLGREPRLAILPGGKQQAGKPAWQPRACPSPGDLWQYMGGLLVKEAARQLWAPAGQGALHFLKEVKGLAGDTIRGFSLGWLPEDLWDIAPAWGLPEILKENGQPKKLWFPKGLTIPYLQGGQVVRVRIRRPEGEPRYYLLRGSSTAAMVMGGGGPVAILVESELDALLLHQEAGELVSVVALGNAQARPDQAAADLLGRCELILVALDADQAGAKEAWGWWVDHFKQARRWPPIQGKDPSESWLAGVDLKLWVQAGLEEYGATA